MSEVENTEAPESIAPIKERKPRSKSEKTMAQEVVRRVAMLRESVDAARSKGVTVSFTINEETGMPQAKVTVGYSIEA